MTDGRPGSGGATSAAGYSMSSMTRSSEPEADDGCLDDDRWREELTHVLFDLGALHGVRGRQQAESEHSRVPPHCFFDVGHAHGGVGDTGEHAGPGYADFAGRRAMRRSWAGWRSGQLQRAISALIRLE